jgi:hypothetical protein
MWQRVVTSTLKTMGHGKALVPRKRAVFFQATGILEVPRPDDLVLRDLRYFVTGLLA